MSYISNQGPLVVPVPLRSLRTVGDEAQGSQCDALEEALATCLISLAELAGAAGDYERVSRVRGALRALGTRDAEAPASRPQPAPQRSRRQGVRARSAPLSGREHEVASLIVHGLTNREIADALVISERTADTHVQNILCKLGLVSRAQVAAWIVEQRPGGGRNRAS
jgi:DNA-binding NarL/FixJ family response regulator